MLTTRGDATRRDALPGMSDPPNRWYDSDMPGRRACPRPAAAGAVTGPAANGQAHPTTDGQDHRGTRRGEDAQPKPTGESRRARDCEIVGLSASAFNRQGAATLRAGSFVERSPGGYARTVPRSGRSIPRGV